MRWEDINTKLLFITTADKHASMTTPRPWEAMPRWFKRWIKGLNRVHDLPGNLALRPRKRNGRRKAKATA